MKKILIVSPFFPYPADAGNKNRVLNMLRHLSTKHRLTFLCYIDKSDIEHIEKLKEYCEVRPVLRPNKKSIFGKIYYKMLSLMSLVLTSIPNEVFYSSIPKLGNEALKLLEKERFDIIQVEYWFTGLSKNFVNKCRGVFKVLDTHDFQSERYEQLFSDSFLGKRQINYIRMKEKEVLNDYDALLAITDRDNKSFYNFFSKDIVTIYNGFEIPSKHFSSDNHTKNIIFFGGMTSQININAVHYFVQSIYPRVKEEVPDVSFTVLGSNPPQEILKLTEKDPSIFVTGYLENIDPVLKKAYLAVLPLNIEYGLRVRALELASKGMPIVATDKSVFGIGFNDKKNIIIASNTDEFVNFTIQLLKNPEFRNKIGEAARDFVNETYSIKNTYGKLAAYYESI